ncbi:MAG: PDZ domain-containing protein [Rhodospirillaceae bacterium]|nr:PDZ domain-containing protein [Rhodospirillaceae bacterium]
MGLRVVVMAALGLLLAGCLSNPYRQSFTPAEGLADRQPYLGQGTGPVVILEGTDTAGDLASMRRQGYDAVGYSEFEGRLVAEDQARDIAREIGANRILVYREDLGTVSGFRPMMVPWGGFYPWRGVGYGGFRSCRTGLPFYGPPVTYIPYSERRYSQVAVFYAPIQPGGLGIFVREASDTERQRLAGKGGAVVTAVVDGSPAARADLRSGDVIVEIDGRPVDGDTFAGEMVPPTTAPTITMVVERNGVRQTKVLDLG